ncbi:uncharacterized protein [Nicotiana tomentosiformis]|uniref:uncharacterized protein isoform X1 n=2 Tax=Nicotiana tomentosiformis TaxID=4098 RepID=UPI00051BC306|nr:uncharacterized protein LOC104116266 isoform X1 [Nicotiana tomentosiformis]
MESPPSLSLYISQNSKKRVFPSGSSIDGQMVDVSPSISWSSKSESVNQKEFIHREIIDVDMEGGHSDAMFIDGNTESSSKGKEILLELSLGHGGSADSGSVDQVQSSKKHCPSESDGLIIGDDFGADLYYGDDVHTDMYFDDPALTEYAIMQSHFDHMDIPPGVEVPIPWMSGPAEAKMAPTATTTWSTSSASKAMSFPFGNEAPKVLRHQSTSWYGSTPVSQPTPFELSSSSLGPAFCKSRLSAKGKLQETSCKEQSGSTNLTLGAGKSFNAQGSSFKRKFRFFEGTASDSWHTQSIPGVSHFPEVQFVPPQMSGWTNLPFNMTTAPASSGSMLAPGGMNSLPMQQVHPAYMLPKGGLNSLPLQQVHPGVIFTTDAMNYFPQQQIYSGSVLAPGPTYYFPQEMDHTLWTQGLHESVTTTESSSIQSGSVSSEGQRRDLGESLKNFRLFKKFDTVQDHSDHFFSGLASLDNQASKSCAKRIQEEWKILEKDLPDTIFVRVYETRMDLLRAVIIGADGTPYHDGLFFFDVFFPSNYPNAPPHVHYHSFGLRINPNLYECGKVCLSLLNTWGGRAKEKWIPGESTMLQVLVSIQGLILNAKPYFNEPGYAKMSGSAMGENCSVQYNESIFILHLKTMVYCMRRPPQHFEDFVVGHYFQSCHDILVACKAYMDGAQVGSLVRGCVLDAVEGDKKSCSQGFKAMLAGFTQTLVDAFTNIGAKDCDKFLPLAQKASTGVAPPVNIESC